jgi:outer membrane protein OmpA-like peptidoglycan-associated protein
MKNTIAIFILIISMVFSNSMFAQQNNTSNAALVEGIISDFEKNIKVGEIIVFENTKTKKVIQVISDEQGKFSINLPYSQTYLIKIKGFNEEKDYTELSIPALEPNQTGLFYNIDIMIELPKMFTLKNVYFETGKANLTQESYTELNKLLDYMKTHKIAVIEIAGHTDNVGEDEANLILSQKRAESVRNFLITGGIDQARVSAKGYGEKQPVATNETPEGRQSNRRTEVRIIKN